MLTRLITHYHAYRKYTEYVHCENEIRDLTATLLTEVCNDVCTEPELQPVTDEELIGATANSQAGARLDIAANGV